MDYKLFTLSNGLNVLIGKTVGLSRATCGLWFRSGSIQESDIERGSAHLLEHMIFKGAIGQQPNEYSTTVTKLGGEDNAWTNFDHTHFYIYLPKENLLQALTLMAQTIFNAAIEPKEFKKEKEVVLEELKMSNDNPWSWLYDHFFNNLYRKSSFRHPILGYEDTLRNLKRNQLYKFYRTWYVPNNAFLVLTSDLDELLLLKQIEKIFGSIKSQPIQYTPLEQEEISGKSEVFKTPKEIQNLYVFGGMLCEGIFDLYQIVSINLLISVLAGSFCSRLHQRLVEKERVATGINLVFDNNQPNPSLYFMAESEDSKNAQKIINSVLDETQMIAEQGITDEEFERVQTSMLSEAAEVQESSFRFAYWLGEKSINNLLPSSLETYRRIIQNKSPLEIQKIAQDLFTDGRRWVFDIAFPNNAKCHVSIPRTKAARTKEVNQNSLTSEITIENYKNIELSYRNTPFTNTIAMVVAIPGVFENEPNPGLSNLLSQTIAKGTSKYSAMQISQRLETYGAGLEIALGHSVLMIKLRVLAEKYIPALEILHEIVENANFTEPELAIGRWQIEAERQALLDSPWGLALLKATQSVFPSYRLGRDLLGPPSATNDYHSDHVRKYHKEIFNHSRVLISVVGNLSKVEPWKQEVINVFQSKNKTKMINHSKNIDMNFQKRQHVEQDKEQIVIVVCYPSVSLTHPNHLKATLFTEMLGGMAMSSRLFVELRDKEGLAYAVTASRVADENCGILCAAISTSFRKREQALAGIIRETSKLCSEKIEQKEFDLIKGYLTHQIASAADTNSAKANRLIHQQICGLPIDYYQKILRELKQLSLKEFISYCRSVNTEEFSVTTVGKRAES